MRRPAWRSAAGEAARSAAAPGVTDNPISSAHFQPAIRRDSFAFRGPLMLHAQVSHQSACLTPPSVRSDGIIDRHRGQVEGPFEFISSDFVN